MYRTKKDVDKHVENLISKLSVKEFKSRAYSIARLYYEVGDYTNCQRYVEQYLSQKDNNAAAHRLLGQAYQKLEQKEKALDQYKISLNIDPTQTSLILDICELLADDEVIIDPGRAKYWCEKAESTFPKHPVTFQLREKLVAKNNSDPELLISLLKSELEVRPKDVTLHARLLKHYLQINKIKEAFDHGCDVEFGGHTFLNNIAWYESLGEILKQSVNVNDWLYQLLLLTVQERICVLSLLEVATSASKSLVECTEFLHTYDQAIGEVTRAGAPPGFGEFHISLIHHHRGQFAFHSATFLLKKAKKNQLSWRDASKLAAPLMLIAWQIPPLSQQANWLSHSPEKQQNVSHRWFCEASYRCSQSGHYLLSNMQIKAQTFLDQISQLCSGSHWKDKIYEKIFTTGDHLAKIKSSDFITNVFSPTLRLPRRIEVEVFDADAQREYANSLHHFVWMLLNYKNYAHFKCTLFDMLIPKSSNYANCGTETLNKHDVLAFLYSATLTVQGQKSNQVSYITSEKPNVLPANITDLLCSLPQMKWWDCAYKFSQNELGTELTDIRSTLSRGIEVVRCIDNHGMDPELLCKLGRIFSEITNLTTSVDEKNYLEARAVLYYSSAIPYLEKLRNKIIVKLPEKRMFDYTHKELNTKELNSLLEQSKLYVANNHLKDCEYEKVIEILSTLRSPQAFYHLSITYKKMALEENNLSNETITNETKTKYTTLLLKAKSFAYKALEKLKETEMNKNQSLYSDVQELIEDIEIRLNKINIDLSDTVNDIDSKYYLDDNLSPAENDQVPLRNNSHIIRNLSSTPKQSSNTNMTNYRTAVESQLFDTTRADQQFLERIENQIKSLQRRDTTINDFMEQTKTWFDENRKLGNQIINTIHSNIQNTTDQFKLLKISVDQVKDQIDDCRNECKDVGELKKQLAELKKEVNKLKKPSSQQNIDENELYTLNDEYRTNDNTSSFAAQLPFTPSQVMPQFNQRLVPSFPVPPNPYQFYGQNLYNLYNQYSQFTQPPSVPGAPPMFDSTRSQVNYPGMYPTPDQMYLDVAHLIPPNLQAAPPIPCVPTISTVPSAPIISTTPPISAVSIPPVSTSIAMSKPTSTKSANDIPRSLPVNVVITSSDPLPTCTTMPAPILSVTIPSKHIKGTPHNYQIPMPPTNETKVLPPPIFSFPASENKVSVTTTSSLYNWNRSTVFQANDSINSGTSNVDDSLLHSSKVGGGTSADNSKSVVDGVFTVVSPNISLNKSRTLSERSNTSVENYDPCPDFKPIIPLPAEVKVTTGEESETVIFSSRAKLYRFVDKQWKERGLGEMKLLKHNITEKVRVLMRREQVHKVCANHIITPEMEIKPMKNETNAYIWVANDFADETVVLEKFCIRFKTADVAQQFYDTFEKARQESNISTTTIIEDKSKPSSDISKTSIKGNTKESIECQPGKTVVGGFTFSSTPTFKTVTNDTKIDIKPEDSTTKLNVFSGLTFKTNTTSSFNNLFNNNLLVNTINPTKPSETPDKLNSSDTVEEFEPTVEFKPVIPLPALIEHKTGEENETILFEHRAKLLRHDANSKEWKERGLGNIKLLVHKDNNQKVRLLMRREQVMKVCCNHAVTKDMAFHKMPNMEKAVTWCAKDFSEGELIPETFCLRFKTLQICDSFIEAIKLAQSKIKDDSKAAKEEQNAAKQNNQVGFGDLFKPKPGSWHCDTCYTNNLENFDKCACCEEPKPQNQINFVEPAVKWGEKFKPKPGSWECKECLIRNDASVENCNACNCPKDPTKSKSENKQTFDNTSKFNFGIPTQTINIQTKHETPVTTMSITIGWGDKFKPKEGTWECKQCCVRNEGNVEQCSACSSPKDPSAVKIDNSLFSNVTSTSKFSFGIPPNAIGDRKPATKTTSMFDGTGAHSFTFGIPSNTQDKTLGVLNFGEQKPTGVIFATPKATTDNETSVSFTLKKDDEDNTAVTPVKPALLPTPQIDSTGTTFGPKEGGTFDFVFKPKSTSIAKSPVKSPKSEKGYESDDNEYATEDDGHNIHFSPIIPMPDKVKVVTGEENEDELYAHRAKLYRFMSGEWKERGIGIVKILKHKENGKLRVLMRREQVLKICLNHALVPEIKYTPKDEKTWLFAANDFSEGELSLQKFCLRFHSKDIALGFKDTIDNAIKGKPVSLLKQVLNSDKKEESDSDDVIFVSEIQASTEEKQKAKELMLPENFFTYKNKEPCLGCRGCRNDNDTKLASMLLISKESTQSSQEKSTPLKTAATVFQSPTTSLYGTPANFNKSLNTSIFRTPTESIGANPQSVTNTPSESNKTVDTTIFRSPLDLIGSNMNSTLLVSTSNDSLKTDIINKENTLVEKPNIFTAIGEQKPVFGASQNKSVNLFGAGHTQSPLSSKGSILAAPKLNNLNISGEEKQSTDPKSIFGQCKSIFGENKSLFSSKDSGVSINKSIFSVQEDKMDDNQKSEVKSIFGSEADKPINLFSSTAQGSLFGPGALKSNDTKSNTGIFGASASTLISNSSESIKLFESGKSTFSTTSNQTSTGTVGSNNNKKTSESTASVFGNEKSDLKTDKADETAELPLNLDNTLSFAALSSKSSGFQIQKNPDFEWEGAGQQLFSSTQKDDTKDETNDNNTSDDTRVTTGGDDEYDPHYEPIVPLPDKIVVTTGEEDEEKLFGERCKLYRYDNNSHEWKERGNGEIKILYHPERKTYRLLLRREQVHKAVLNMLLFMDFELKPLSSSDRSWVWSCRNYAENPTGVDELLAVRFNSVALSTAFRDKLVECVRKLQAAAAQFIREEKEAAEISVSNVAPLRLPKHLEGDARADAIISATVKLQTQSVQPTTIVQTTQSAQPTQLVIPTVSTQPAVEQSQHSAGHDSASNSNGEIDKSKTSMETPKQVHFQEPDEESHGEEDYEHDYEPENEDYEAYYHEEDDESAVYYECEGEAVVTHGDSETHCPEARVQVLFDQEIYSPKIMVSDTSTGEILADMLIHTDTEFQTYGESCTWSGTDYTTNDPVDKTVTINFHDIDTAMQFYDSCETSKAATYSSTDPES